MTKDKKINWRVCLNCWRVIKPHGRGGNKINQCGHCKNRTVRDIKAFTVAVEKIREAFEVQGSIDNKTVAWARFMADTAIENELVFGMIKTLPALTALTTLRVMTDLAIHWSPKKGELADYVFVKLNTRVALQRGCQPSSRDDEKVC